MGINIWINRFGRSERILWLDSILTSDHFTHVVSVNWKLFSSKMQELQKIGEMISKECIRNKSLTIDTQTSGSSLIKSFIILKANLNNLVNEKYLTFFINQVIRITSLFSIMANKNCGQCRRNIQLKHYWNFEHLMNINLKQVDVFNTSWIICRLIRNFRENLDWESITYLSCEKRVLHWEILRNWIQ